MSGKRDRSPVGSVRRATAGAFRRTWNSPTAMTWGGLLARSASVAVVLPLVLSRFPVEEISVWYLFSTIIGLQLLADFGFSTSFVRAIAYSGGSSTSVVRAAPASRLELSRILSTMRYVYFGAAVAGGFALGIFGTWAIIRPVSLVADPESVWVAWAVVVAVSSVNLWASLYTSYLRGVDRIALWRRWEMITSAGAIVTSILVLIAGGNLLALVLGNQLWVLIGAQCNRVLARGVNQGEFSRVADTGVDPQVMKLVWPSAWRSGLGVLMSFGVVQATGILYAQLATPSEVAAYLIALRVMSVLNTFSQAPFYSKIPTLSRLYAEGSRRDLVNTAAVGMQRSYWSFVLPFLIVGIAAHPLLVQIRSRADFVDPLLWGLMGLGVLLERYGAMHTQLYSTTNHVVWHISNGVTGCVYLILCLLLWPHLRVYAFPAAYVLANLLFYTWYAARYSHREFNLTFRGFDLRLVAFPAVFLGIYLVLASTYLK